MEAMRAKTIEDLFVDGSEIDCALKRAVRKALIEHKRARNPIAEWREGEIFWVQPDDIPEEEDLPESV